MSIDKVTKRQRKGRMNSGRYSKVLKRTLIADVLEEKDLNYTDFYNLVKSKFPKSNPSMATLNDFVTGRRTDCRLSTLQKMCIALEVTLNDIAEPLKLDSDEISK